MIPRKKFRFGERQAAPTAPDALIALTAKDEANLEAYVAKIKETVAILREEISAIKAGELEVISNVFDDKSRVLKWLELHTPLVEPFLNHEIAQKSNIKRHLTDLKKEIEEDGAMLSRMAVAAKRILREVEKINNRNGLGDIYGKSGQKVSGVSGRKMRIDYEL
jgi:ABC-type phosphate transport system auxiliary subunit